MHYSACLQLRCSQQQQQTFKVWQPQRAARSKRPNTPSDGSKHNGFQTTSQAVLLISKHVSSQDRAHDQEHHSSIGCNGMANNDDYHGLEMCKNHAKDSTTEGYLQPDPTTMLMNLRLEPPWNVANMECGRINPSKLKATNGSYRDRALDQEHHPLFHRLQWHGKQ